ncbi:MAG: hypothetical protein ACOYU0_04540 [Nitrospirota bacterium]
MPNPLASITPILDLLGRELKILPATGGAVEELQTLIRNKNGREKPKDKVRTWLNID